MTTRAHFADQLHAAFRHGRTVPPLIEQDPSLTIDDAYVISLAVLERRVAEGEVVVGKKIGVTSKVVQDMMGVDQPDFGFLSGVMRVEGGIDIATHRLIAPRAEAEIAFFLKSSLLGPGVTEADVLAATDRIAACFEIVDSRIRDWKIGIVDTVADNASCGVFVIGDAHSDPASLDLAGLKATVTKNGEYLFEGLGASVQGSPLAAVAWLANTLGRHGVRLDAGDVILSGSLVPLEDAVRGDEFEMVLDGVGRCVARFR